MNREIKFRAWLDDGYNKWMEYDFYIHSSSGILYDQAATTYDTPNIEIEQTYNLTLMQYTGIKDCNGKEIYEGDIVSIFDYYNEDYVVEYPFIDLHRMVAINKNVIGEIIGNIYETPDLLDYWGNQK